MTLLPDDPRHGTVNGYRNCAGGPIVTEIRPASGDGQARLPVRNPQRQAATPEEVRATLSQDYPRLDIRLGRTCAHPCEAKDPAPMSHGWINENGEVVPFNS